MILARLSYRAWQFWKFLGSRPSPEQLALARRLLSSEQMSIFEKMQASEQAHSLDVLARLQELGETEMDLQVAALLHDVGKSRFPLSVWERVWIVLAGAVFPGLVRCWGSGPVEATVPGWIRIFMVAEQHAQWGAQMAEVVGTSPLAVALVRRHQEKNPPGWTNTEEELLARLQSVDDRS